MNKAVKIAAGTATAIALTLGGAGVAAADTGPDGLPNGVLASSEGAYIGSWDGPVQVETRWLAKRWGARKAVAKLRAAGVEVKLAHCLKSGYRKCITASSYAGATEDHKLGSVQLWSSDQVLYAADVTMDSKDGRKVSKKTRVRATCILLGQAAGMRVSMAKKACS